MITLSLSSISSSICLIPTKDMTEGEKRAWNPANQLLHET